MAVQATLEHLSDVDTNYLLTEEQVSIKQYVREFAEKVIAPRAAQIDEEAKFPFDIYKQMLENGLISLPYPTEYGGDGIDPVTELILVEELSRVDLSCCLVCNVNTLGASPILLAGSEEQKKKYITQITSGEKICAFGLTEAGAGSDFMGINTKAVKKGDKYILNGSKLFISHGGVADVTTVFAKTDNKPGLRSLSCFIVERDYPGYSVGKKENKLGIRGSETAEIVFEDVEVPVENLIASEGSGWKIAMSVLDHSRPGVGMQGIGVAQGAFDYALKYAQEREQFNQSIGNFEAIRQKFGRMLTKIETGRLLGYKAASAVFAKSKEGSSLSSLSKFYGGDTAMYVTTEAVQILGGYGYTKEFPVERMMRDAKITQIYEGTNEVQRMVVSRHVIKSCK